jgi:outer membrane immunogenic protein
MQFHHLKLTVLALLAGSCAAGPALAQDAGPADWSGFYAGVYAGYGLDDRPATSSSGVLPFSEDLFGTLESSATGVDTLLGGVRGGWNHQSGPLVLGLESALTLGSFSRSTSASFFATDAEEPPSSVEQSLSSVFETNAIATLEGRLGLAVDNWMLYGKAGVAAAYGTTDASAAFSYVDADDPEDSVDLPASGSTAGLLFGTTVGLGAEMLVTDTISVGAEYSYVYLPAQELNLLASGIGFGSDDIVSSQGAIGIHSLKAGVNFHF